MKNENEAELLLDSIMQKPAPLTRPKAKAANIPLAQLHPFEHHPYKVQDNEEMESLTESIRENGVLSPLIVRPLETGEYEVISGHRRLHAAEKAGLKTVPALIYALDRNTAVIALVDSNLHREHILPSEKAFAYKLKMEAMSRQGKRTDLTSDQVGPKLTTQEVSDEDSASQVKRYIRLTNLIPQVLDYVDNSKIALTPAVELSYLTIKEQRDLLDTMESEDCTPSLSQAQQLKNLSQGEGLNMDKILAILTEEKANQKEKLRIPMERIRSFFPKDYTAAQIEQAIVKICEQHYRNKMRDRDER